MESEMSDLHAEIAAYDALAARLESAHLGEWAVVRQGVLVGLYSSFEAAADEAMRRFGRGPYLIRQVGAAQLNLPTSLMYRPLHEADPRRL